jgi:dihydroorotate dehydrogenase
MEEKLTPEQVDQKIEEAKQRIRQNKLDSVRVGNSVYTSQQITEHKAKKERSRKRNKVQKASRKRNRSK